MTLQRSVSERLSLRRHAYDAACAQKHEHQITRHIYPRSRRDRRSPRLTQDETVPETPLQDSSTPIAEGVPMESGAEQTLAQVQATRVKGIEDANHPDKLINLRKGDLVKIVTHLRRG